MKSKMDKAMSQRKQRGALGDEWETPWPVFHFIEKKLGVTFTVDLGATKRNAKCKRYVSSNTKDGIQTSWDDHDILFCNPPYSKIEKWLAMMECEARVTLCISVVLIRSDTGTKWFHKYAPLAHEIAFLIPRVNYIPPPGVNASSNSHGSMVMVFKPGRKKNHKPKIHFWQWREFGRR